MKKALLILSLAGMIFVMMDPQRGGFVIPTPANDQSFYNIYVQNFPDRDVVSYFRQEQKAYRIDSFRPGNNITSIIRGSAPVIFIITPPPSTQQYKQQQVPMR
jgi:hypothetical protein